MYQESENFLRRISCPEFEVTESPVDTQYFGIPSAKVMLKDACSPVCQAELLAFMRNFEFITITNQSNNTVNNHWLGERTTSFLTDMNVQFTKKISPLEEMISSSTSVSDNFPGDEQILQIARSSFAVSRFLNDPYLPADPARCIYADITQNAFGKIGRFFVIHHTQNMIDGFLLFSISGSTAIIELVTASQNAKGRGIGKTLLKSMEWYVSKAGLESIQVGTQLANTVALKFYLSYGFGIKECNSIYHYWPSKS